MGGGRTPFEAAMDNGTTISPVCKRGDNRDLINDWKVDKTNKGKKAAFLQNRQDLLNPELESNDYVLGISIYGFYLSFQNVLQHKAIILVQVCLHLAIFLTK